MFPNLLVYFNATYNKEKILFLETKIYSSFFKEIEWVMSNCNSASYITSVLQAFEYSPKFFFTNVHILIQKHVEWYWN